MNTFALLAAIALLRPQAGNLIQTILERGSAGESVPLGIVDENGSNMLSLRTIVRAMEVLDDFSKTQDFGAAAPSRTRHAYYVVERAVSGQRASFGQLSSVPPGEPQRRVDAGHDASGVHSGTDDNRSDHRVAGSE